MSDAEAIAGWRRIVNARLIVGRDNDIRDAGNALADAFECAKADAWDECLDTIEKHELNTKQARTGNPYRASIEQKTREEK